MGIVVVRERKGLGSVEKWHGDMGMVTEGDNWGERYNYGHARAKTCMDEWPRTWCKERRVEKNR